MSKDKDWAFSLDRTFGNKRVCLRLSVKPSRTSGSEFWFGNPKIDESGMSEPGGYYLRVQDSADGLRLSTDLLGGFRCYALWLGDTLYLSDRWPHLVDRLRESGSLVLDPEEHLFWQLHRYTTGGRTLFLGLDKLPPASDFVFTSDGLACRNRFPDILCEPDADRHTQVIWERLVHWADSLRPADGPVVLFFSGGLDSTLLALVLQRRGIPFVPLFCRPDPIYPEAERDLARARARSKLLGITLHEMDVHLDLSPEGTKRVAQDLLFDRHFGVLHYAAMKAVQAKWGDGACIVNGQSADSILSYGPSEPNLGNRAARTLLYRANGLQCLIACMAARMRFKKPLALPKGDDERLLAFFDGDNYFPLLHLGRPQVYSSYLRSLLKEVAGRFSSFESARMYLKVYGFLQGADNQVVLQSARAVGCVRVEMPFTDPEIVFATMRNRDPKLELRMPKYPVRRLLDKHLPDWAVEKFAQRIDPKPLVAMASLVDDVYAQILRELTSRVASGGLEVRSEQ